MKTILQVPLDKQLKSNAEKIASDQGFSSLQEIIRVFLTQLALNKVRVTFQESVSLSLKNEKRYTGMTNDFQSGKNNHSVTDVSDLISKLNAD
ncbi:MAG: hypothetical protein Q7R49_05875 [Candidatus Daviesbacteria bacterium]|nr:hypothetical protein [Candidatus Daviesbacteria bacterium]